ncbi:MAG: hypothetical protein KI793_26035 [Rivularia sp. (in: Bacteria)]|nr:hypothetical protein [Rivularia sp. MS3]
MRLRKNGFLKMKDGYINLLNYLLLLEGFILQAIALVKGDRPQYGTSKVFSMRNPGNDLYDVLKILKKLIQTASI